MLYNEYNVLGELAKLMVVAMMVDTSARTLLHVFVTNLKARVSSISFQPCCEASKFAYAYADGASVWEGAQVFIVEAIPDDGVLTTLQDTK